MTIDEARLKYGDSTDDYYVSCLKCPCDGHEVCPMDKGGDCSGYEDAWDAIAKRITELESPAETPAKTPKKKSGDPVEHPDHYNQGSIECIDAMIAAFGKEKVRDWCVMTSFKYHWRYQHKNGDEDIRKASWYIEKYKELTDEKEDISVG